MKKLFYLLATGMVIASCGGATDGDANTDTTNFDNRMPENTTGILGDTSVDMDSNGSVSNPQLHTGNDSAVRNRDTNTIGSRQEQGQQNNMGEQNRKPGNQQ